MGDLMVICIDIKVDAEALIPFGHMNSPLWKYHKVFNISMRKSRRVKFGNLPKTSDWWPYVWYDSK